MKELKKFIEKFLLNFNNFFSLIVKTYFITVGFLWVFIYLYFRLFYTKTSYLLVDIKEYINLKIVILAVIFVIIHFSMLLNILIYWYRNKYNKKPSAFITNISSKLTEIVNIIYWKPLNTIYEKYHSDIPWSGIYFLFLESRWTKKQRGKYYFYSIIVLFDILPRIIMALVFFIDVVIYSQIKYFFWVIPLLFIPIIFRIFIKLMVSFSINNIPILSNYFNEIIGVGKRKVNFDETLISYEKYNYTVKDEYLGVIDAEEEMGYLLQLEHILFYMDQLKRDKDYFDHYCIFLTSILYLIAGIIRLFIIYF